jgi:hypothetical protein
MPSAESNRYPRLINWILGCLFAALLGGLTVFYLLFHLGLRIPMERLWEPFVIVSVLTLGAAPGLYWARKEQTLHGGDHRRLFAVIGSYTLVVLLVYIRYGLLEVLFPGVSVNLLYLLCLIWVPAIFALGIYTRKSLFRRN